MLNFVYVLNQIKSILTAQAEQGNGTGSKSEVNGII